MLIKVRKIKGQKIKRKELVYAANWFGEMLMGKRLCNNLYIEITFMDLGTEIGSCADLDGEYRPREFEVFLTNDMNRKEILLTLAHEMVHVKQFARRELANFDTRDMPLYQGKKVYITDIHYYDWPWEIEAYGRSIGLIERYKDHIRENKLFNEIKN